MSASRREISEPAVAMPFPHLPGPASPPASLKPRASSPRRRRRHRRGVLLLVVLSILVLFVVIAVTFVLIAGQFRRGARAEKVVERYTNDPQRQLDDAFYQLIRGTDNEQSSIFNHDLLADMYGTAGGQLDTYGNGGWSGYLSTAAAPTPVAGGQLIDLPVVPVFAGNFTALSQIWGYYNGQVLTMLNGPARGVSTRIVGYQYVSANSAVLRVMAFDGVLSSTFVSGWSAAVEQRFVINGRAFNGTGFGYNVGSRHDDAFLPPANPMQTAPTYYYALLPNYRYNGYNGGPGGADEDYDAPDYQNLALAYAPVFPATLPTPTAPQTLSSVLAPLPSFHRPDLIAWWANQGDGGMPAKYPWSDSTSTSVPNSLALNRQVILRPMGRTVLYPQNNPANNPVYLDVDGHINAASGNHQVTDHPMFTGSNPGNPSQFGYFDPVNGPWDVDNDGDGVPDSVWLDLGFPVQTSADGKTYKPLFAFMILDLDGRLNVNAHGNITQTQPATVTLPSGTPTTNPLFELTTLGPFAFGGSQAAGSGNGTADPTSNLQNPSQPNVAYTMTPLQNSVQLPRGQGYGPAEINLGYPSASSPGIYGSNYLFTSMNYYQALMTGTGVGGAAPTTNMDGRYGEYGTSLPLPGLSANTNLTATITADDVLANVKHSDIPQNYFAAQLTSYGTPPDLWGRSALGLDFRGQPVFSFPYALGLTAPFNDFERPNSPYSLNQSRTGIRVSMSRGAVDNLYSPAELERLLRRFDSDGYALPDRLRNILDPNDGITELRHLVTTDSNDLPSPSIQGTTEINTLLAAGGGVYTAAGPSNLNVSDMLITKLVNSGNFNIGTMQNINLQLQKMLPPELAAGQYMDLNRPFGNGFDDNGNFAVDEPTEYAGHIEAGWNNLFPNIHSTVPFNLLNYMDFNAANGVVASGAAATYPGAGSTSDSLQLNARQLYARHLYVLMMLLIDQGYIPNYIPGAAGTPPTSTMWGNGNAFSSSTETLTAAAQKELTARRIAQWAINAADYRDADSIMTPFEYDINPFNGWDVDGYVGTNPLTSATDDTAPDRRLVWGCEYPELMITETLASHDRRVRDAANDNVTGKPRYTPVAPYTVQDATMDQIRIPQGSLFVELYCPRANTAGAGGTQAVLPGDLYAYNPGTQQWSLNLAAPAPPNNSNFQNPVWRLVVLNSNLKNVSNGVSLNNIAVRMQNNPVTTSLDPPDAPQGGVSYNFSVFSQNPNLDPSGLTGYAQIERIIWFTTSGPTQTNDPHYGKVYYNWGTTQASNAAALSPGDYAVVGPRPYTTFGRVLTGNTASLAGQAPTGPPPLSPQAIQITPSVSYSSTNAMPNVPYPTVGTNIQQPLGIVCAGPKPANTTPPWSGSVSGGGNTVPNGIGVSVSEPLYSSPFYYPEPTNVDTAVQQVAAYNNLADAYGSDGATPAKYLDMPVEAYLGGAAANTNRPLVADAANNAAVLQTGTYYNYKTVLLQRLANPYTAYNPSPSDPNEPTPGQPGGYDSTLPVNPYITIDWMPVNLTIFNGEQVPLADPTNAAKSIDPDDQYFLPAGGALPLPPATLAINGTAVSINAYATNAVTASGGTLGSAQRGVTGNTPSVYGLNLWFPAMDAFPSNGGQRGGNNLVFDYNFDYYGHTLGYLNRAFMGTNAGAPGHPWSNSDTVPAPAQYVGDPNPNFWLPSSGAANNLNRTFPWINWANRPFISHYELMQVPASSPTRLLWEFGYLGQNSTAPSTVPTYQDAYDGTSTVTNPPMFLTPFPFLMNFRMTAPSTLNGGTIGQAPHFYRLFDYARVPSRFVGTETYLNPNVTAAQLNDTTTGATEQQMFSYLHPPFNKVSKYREPGKVNINTIPHLAAGVFPAVAGLSTGDANPVIWNAVVNDPAPFTVANPTGATGLNNGDPTIAGPGWQRVAKSIQGPWTGMGTYPTMFGNPFRSFGGADLTITGLGFTPRGIDVTMMRPDPYVNTSMLFDSPPPGVTTYASTNSIANLFQAFNAPDRNSYFRYQNLQRLGNSLTTRSNVYAVWVTVGYFQVQPWTGAPNNTPANSVIDNAHPDGYQLADELGSDTGDIVRHRAFYIFDRTIPVGYERGQNHNVDRAVLLRRYIE